MSFLYVIYIRRELRMTNKGVGNIILFIHDVKNLTMVYNRWLFLDTEHHSKPTYSFTPLCLIPLHPLVSNTCIVHLEKVTFVCIFVYHNHRIGRIWGSFWSSLWARLSACRLVGLRSVAGFRIRIRSDPVLLTGSGSGFKISLDPDPVSAPKSGS